MKQKLAMAPTRSASDSERDRSAHPMFSPASSFLDAPACRKLRIRDRAVETAMLNESARGEKLLTKGEVAQLCRVEIRTVDRWVAAGKIRCYRIPSGRLLFRKRDVLMATDRQAGRVA